MVQNLYSLGLLRNGKVYANKQLAIQGLTQSATNDGVAKLARYLEEISGTSYIRTVVGFYANAAEMEDAGGGQSSYTILDIDGSAADLVQLSGAVESINDIIGDGIGGETLTEAIEELNESLGTGFTSAHTVADALAELEEALKESLKVTIEENGESSEYAKVYTIKQGGETIGEINIPKDIVIKSGSLVYGLWSGETFEENTEEHYYGDEPAIKLVLNNDDVLYINARDLVDTYTAGDGIEISSGGAISLKIDSEGEPFLTVGEDGIKIDGVQTAIEAAIDQNALEAGDGISIHSNKVNAVAAGYSAPAIKNPITVDESGIKFSSMLDCGFYDSNVQVASNAEEVNAIDNPNDTDLFLTSEEAVESLAKGNGKTFNSISVANTELDTTVQLTATDSIVIDGLDVSGTKDNGNGKVLLSAPSVEINGATVENGSTVYNVFEQVGGAVDTFTASNITVDNPRLAHNVLNVYTVSNGAKITVKDSSFNLTVDNSNVLRLANYTNADNVEVTFENVDWTYENSTATTDWRWAGLIIYQPASGDAALGNDTSHLETWTFKFKNCRYNGVKVTENNFGEHNQVFYLYNVGNTGGIVDPLGRNINISFE